MIFICRLFYALLCIHLSEWIKYRNRLDVKRVFVFFIISRICWFWLYFKSNAFIAPPVWQSQKKKRSLIWDRCWCVVECYLRYTHSNIFVQVLFVKNKNKIIWRWRTECNTKCCLSSQCQYMRILLQQCFYFVKRLKLLIQIHLNVCLLAFIVNADCWCCCLFSILLPYFRSQMRG